MEPVIELLSDSSGGLVSSDAFEETDGEVVSDEEGDAEGSPEGPLSPSGSRAPPRTRRGLSGRRRTRSQAAADGGDEGSADGVVVASPRPVLRRRRLVRADGTQPAARQGPTNRCCPVTSKA